MYNVYLFHLKNYIEPSVLVCYKLISHKRTQHLNEVIQKLYFFGGEIFFFFHIRKKI